MRLTRTLILIMVLLCVSSDISLADLQNKKSVGLLLGDPIALSLRIPVQEKTFLSVRAGIWTWSFWHDINYNTPYFSLDYAWLFPVKHSSYRFYAGAGMALFLADNPKDKRNYDAAAGIRLPLGIELAAGENLSVGFELAPMYQIAPAFNFKPYIIELNGGLVVLYSF